MLLPNRTPEDVAPAGRLALDEAALASASVIVNDVRTRGEVALREHAERLGDIQPGESWYVPGEALQPYLAELSPSDRGVLDRAHQHIRSFAEGQRACLSEFQQPVAGGMIGHQVAPVARAGCYAPGGRFPLPSSVLMTAATARAAGVEKVWVASPRPHPRTLAAAALAGADGVLKVGGAQAIAALAYGAGPIAPCDAVVGPGNKWVTAAKQLVSGQVVIDMLAGPSEVLIIADERASAAVVAADLLAQCEHDVDARGILVTPSLDLIQRVRAELVNQLESLPTRDTAEAALLSSAAVYVDSLNDACRVSDAVAPEHLEVFTLNPSALLPKLNHYGALFVGEGSAEVLGDYGLGPNHTLPTGGTARSVGGLSVFTFLRVRTYMELDRDKVSPDVYQDAANFARMEGLEAHARSAEARLTKKNTF